MPMVHRSMPFAIDPWQAGNKEELFNVLSCVRKILGFSYMYLTYF